MAEISELGARLALFAAWLEVVMSKHRGGRAW